MTRAARLFPLILSAIAVLCLTAPTSAQRLGHDVGDFFPDVELPTIDGTRSLRLSSFRGQKLLLIEFASW